MVDESTHEASAMAPDHPRHRLRGFRGGERSDRPWLRPRRLASKAVALTFALLSYERIPAMLVLLAFGVLVAVLREPALVSELGDVSVHFRLPEFALTKLGWQDLATGVLVLGLAQAALTLGNAIVATVEENNHLFPARPITV